MQITKPRLSWKSIRPLARACDFTLAPIAPGRYAAYPQGTGPEHPQAVICDYPKTMAGVFINMLSRRM